MANLNEFMVVLLVSERSTLLNPIHTTRWRMLSEWCDENRIGKPGEIMLQNAIDHYEENKAKERAAAVDIIEL
jgi:hypothetical protein